MERNRPFAVDAEAVRWAYRLILGREPESQAVIDHHMNCSTTLSDLRNVFLSSEEFKVVFEGYRDTYVLQDSVEDLVEDNAFHAMNARAAASDEKSVFFRGTYLNFWPRLEKFSSETFLEDFVMKGWMPDSRSIDSTTKVTTFGSCFAVGIANHLSKLGYNLSKDRDPEIYISKMGEGFVNIYSILQQFEWALEGKAPPADLWHGFDAEVYGISERIRDRTRAVFLDTDFFIITLGLSEVWFDEATGGVLWRGVPWKSYDAARHRFRLCSVEETKQAVSRIYELIRRHVPNAKTLFTLSPIPLLATFRPVSCLTANSVSKAILRSALDEFYREHEEDLNSRLFYFPSYEIANELFPIRFLPDCRHPAYAIVDFIMQTFEVVHCRTGRSLREMNRLFHARRQANKKGIDRIRD